MINIKKIILFFLFSLLSNSSFIYADEQPQMVGLSLGKAIGIAEAQTILTKNPNINIKEFKKECTSSISRNFYFRKKLIEDKAYSINFCIDELTRLKNWFYK